MAYRNIAGWPVAAAIGFAIIFTLLAVPACLGAQVTGDADHTVSLEFRDVSLKVVITMLAEASGANIIVLNQDQIENQMVTMRLSGVSVEDALENILNGTGINWEKKNNIYYVGGKEAAAKVVPPDLRGDPPVRPPTLAETPKPKKDTRSITKYRAKYLSCEDLAEILQTGSCANYGMVADYDMTKGRWSTNRVPLSQAALRAHGNTSESTNPADAIVGDGIEMKSGVGIEPTVQYKQIGAARPGGGGVPGGIPGGMPGGNSGGNPGGAGNNGAGQQFLPEGVTVTPYPLDNSILVRGDAEAIEKLQEIIDLLDIPPTQVEIKTAFVEVTEGSEDRFGIDWRTRLGALSIGVTGPNFGGDVPRIDWQQGNWQATLQVLMSENKAKVVNAPIITTMNNRPATITISEQIPVETALNTVTPGGGQSVSYEGTYMTAETGLMVLPRVNGDGSIDVVVSPVVTDATQTKILPHSGEWPIFTSQTLQTQRRVMSGQTIVLGGLSRKSTSTDKVGVPILRDVPFIGKLFEGHRLSSTNSELLIFLTPTLIKDVTQGTIAPSP